MARSVRRPRSSTPAAENDPRKKAIAWMGMLDAGRVGQGGQPENVIAHRTSLAIFTMQKNVGQHIFAATESKHLTGGMEKK